MEWLVWLALLYVWAQILWLVVLSPLNKLLFRVARPGSITDEQVKLIVRESMLRRHARCPSSKALAEMSSNEASSLIGKSLNTHEPALWPLSIETREEIVQRVLDEVRRERVQYWGGRDQSPKSVDR